MVSEPSKKKQPIQYRSSWDSFRQRWVVVALDPSTGNYWLDRKIIRDIEEVMNNSIHWRGVGSL